MLQGRSLIILVVALMFGLGAVIVANAYFSGVEQRQDVPTQGMTKIAVARVPLQFGETLTAEKFKLVDWPNWSMPDGAFTSSEQLLPMGKTHVVLRPMAANEPILRSKLSGEGGRATLAALLRPDMRAFAVRVSEVTGVAGFVLPGDTVDVLVTRAPTSGNGDQITDILLQNVRVIAIDQDPSDDKSDPKVGKTATLEVNQSDAQKLALAQQVGSISLALKKTDDQPRPMVETVNTDDLRDTAYAGSYSGPVAATATGSASSGAAYRPRRYRAVTPRPATGTVEIVRGLNAQNYEVGRYVGY